MYKVFAPLETEFVQQDGKHLEVVVLFVTYHVNHFVYGIVAESQFGCTDILCHVDGCSVGTEQKFLVQSFRSQVGPYGTVFFAEKQSFVKPFQNFLFTFEISLRFIIYLVETYAKGFIGDIEAGIDPFVHFTPKGADFRIIVFPFYQHFAGFLDERGFIFGFLLAHTFFHKLLDLFFIVFVKSHIVVSDEVVAFNAGTFRSGTVPVFQPRQHAFADMYAAVVHDIGFHHAIAIGCHDVGQGAS